MNKTAIEWCDMTWNSVTGCLHGCEYCYARGIAKRFEGGGYGKQNGMFYAKYKDNAFLPPYDLSEPHYTTTKNGWYRKASYPFGFAPTFHRYRLSEPAKRKKPQRIFVCSMADLFGDWVPDEWIKTVFEACEAASQHKYLFLTKNPKRYLELYENKDLPYKDNFWFGTTCTKPSDEFTWVRNTPYKCFVSIEPILEPFGTLENGEWPDWVIIGAETGNRKDKVIPKREWILDIVNQCHAADVPVFMKNSLASIWSEPLIREWPEGLR